MTNAITKQSLLATFGMQDRDKLRRLFDSLSATDRAVMGCALREFHSKGEITGKTAEEYSRIMKGWKAGKSEGMIRATLDKVKEIFAKVFLGRTSNIPTASDLMRATMDDCNAVRRSKIDHEGEFNQALTGLASALEQLINNPYKEPYDTTKEKGDSSSVFAIRENVRRTESNQFPEIPGLLRNPSPEMKSKLGPEELQALQGLIHDYDKVVQSEDGVRFRRFVMDYTAGEDQEYFDALLAKEQTDRFEPLEKPLRKLVDKMLKREQSESEGGPEVVASPVVEAAQKSPVVPDEDEDADAFSMPLPPKDIRTDSQRVKDTATGFEFDPSFGPIDYYGLSQYWK